MDDVGRLWTGIGVCAAVILLMAFLTLCENAAVEFNDAKLKKMAEEDKDLKAIRLAALLTFMHRFQISFTSFLMYILRLRIILSAYVHLL